MNPSAGDTLDYIAFLVRRVMDGDILSATLMVLMELDFVDYHDSFEPVQYSIVCKAKNPTLQMSEVYLAVSKELGMDIKSVEVAVRSGIAGAWKCKRDENWLYFFPNDLKKKKHPSNKEFISRIAHFIILWSKCKKEVPYATE